jgi:hypothetical protein
VGGHPYSYTVPYQDDVQKALDALRAQELAAGRYNPAMPFPFGFGDSPGVAPGAQHASIEEALDASMEDGTRSILDIARVESEPDFCVAAPFSEDELVDLFGTTQPTKADVERSNDLFADIDRGHCRYVVLYESGVPTELFFAGYSFD